MVPASASATFGAWRRSISPDGRCQSRCTASGPASRSTAGAVRGPTPGNAVAGAKSGLRIAGRMVSQPSPEFSPGSWSAGRFPAANRAAMVCRSDRAAENSHVRRRHPSGHLPMRPAPGQHGRRSRHRHGLQLPRLPAAHRQPLRDGRLLPQGGGLDGGRGTGPLKGGGLRAGRLHPLLPRVRDERLLDRGASSRASRRCGRLFRRARFRRTRPRGLEREQASLDQVPGGCAGVPPGPGQSATPPKGE